MSFDDYLIEASILNDDSNYKVLDKIFSKEQKIAIHVFLQRELAKEMAVFKDELNKKFINYDNRMFSYVNNLESNLNDLIIRVNTLFEKSNVFLAKMDKIDNLGKNVDSINELLTFHDIRINNLIKELSNACFKYDKIFLNNLIIPGKIGDFCKYKNLKEYLEYSFNQFIQFDNFSKKQTIVLNDMKNKIENLDNNLSRQINTLKQTNFDFINLKIEELKNSQNGKMNELNELIQKNRIIIDSNNINIRKDMNDMSESNSKNLKKEEDEINNVINEFKEIKKNFFLFASFMKEHYSNQKYKKKDIIENQMNKLILNLLNTNKSFITKLKDDQMEDLINRIINKKDNRKHIRSLTNKSLRKFKQDDEKEIQSNFIENNASSTNLPIQKYFSSVNVNNSKLKNISIEKSIPNIEEEINGSSSASNDISNKSISIIEYNLQNSNDDNENENEKENENDNENENEHDNENNILVMIKKIEEKIELIKQETNNKINNLEEKINSFNSISLNLQNYLSNLKSKKKMTKNVNESESECKEQNNSDSSISGQKNKILDKFHLSVPIHSKFSTKIPKLDNSPIIHRNSFFKKYLNDTNSSFKSSDSKILFNNNEKNEKNKTAYNKFLFKKKKIEDKENSVLITLSGNFLKPFKNGLLNVPQINLSKKKKKNKKN